MSWQQLRISYRSNGSEKKWAIWSNDSRSSSSSSIKNSYSISITVVKPHWLWKVCIGGCRLRNNLRELLKRDWVISRWRGRRDSEEHSSSSKIIGVKVLPYRPMIKKTGDINPKTNKKQSKVKKFKGLGLVPWLLLVPTKGTEAQSTLH